MTTGTSVWDPERYLQFADHRARPFLELTARIGAGSPDRVVDLGCGPGRLTRTLAERWPTAQVLGVDSSPEMIGSARELDVGAEVGARLRFDLGDLRSWTPATWTPATWTPATNVDVIVSNATLHWVPGHRDQLRRLAGLLAPDGWLAVQVPGNFGEPSHRLLRELAGSHPFAEHTAALVWPESFDPADYLADLVGLGEPELDVDAWETTYLQVLDGEDPVYDWISGTAARPVLQALPDGLRADFIAEYRARLRQTYPGQPFGTVLPYRRVFVVAHRRTDRTDDDD